MHFTIKSHIFSFPKCITLLQEFFSSPWWCIVCWLHLLGVEQRPQHSYHCFEYHHHFWGIFTVSVHSVEKEAVYHDKTDLTESQSHCCILTLLIIHTIASPTMWSIVTTDSNHRCILVCYRPRETRPKVLLICHPSICGRLLFVYF